MFDNKITRIASLPPWAKKHIIDGQEIYWAEVGSKGHPIALRVKDNRIHLPKSLRGKSVSDIRQEDLDNVDKSDSPKVHYGLWKKDFDRKSDNDKIYDGYKFNHYGLVLLERLKRFFAKNKLDDVSTLGLDPKYSIDLGIFDNLTKCTDISKVQRVGRTLAKKYRMINELLKSGGKAKLASRMDKDFYYNWDKLEHFFDFDPASYKPTSPDKEDEPEEKMAETSELIKTKDEFIGQAHHLVQPQMAGFIKAMTKFDKAVTLNNTGNAKEAFQSMNTELIRLIGMGANSETGKAAEQILHIPAMISLHHQLFGVEK